MKDLVRGGSHANLFILKHVSNELVHGDPPGIPVQSFIKSSPTRSHHFSVTLIVLIKFRDYPRIRLALCLKRQDIAVLAISNRVRYSPCISGDDGHAESVGLSEDIRGTIGPRRKDEKVGRGVEFLDRARLLLVVFVQERDDLHPFVSNTTGRRRATND